MVDDIWFFSPPITLAREIKIQAFPFLPFPFLLLYLLLAVFFQQIRGWIDRVTGRCWWEIFFLLIMDWRWIGSTAKQSESVFGFLLSLWAIFTCSWFLSDCTYIIDPFLFFGYFLFLCTRFVLPYSFLVLLEIGVVWFVSRCVRDRIWAWDWTYCRICRRGIGKKYYNGHRWW